MSDNTFGPDLILVSDPHSVYTQSYSGGKQPAHVETHPESHLPPQVSFRWILYGSQTPITTLEMIQELIRDQFLEFRSLQDKKEDNCSLKVTEVMNTFLDAKLTRLTVWLTRHLD